jgi:butyrate kinase
MLKRPYAKCRLVVAHLGTGITVAAHVGGRQVDASNANDDGPFSPQRTGTLPLSAVVRLCFSGRYTEQQVLEQFQRRGGMLSYFNTDDIRKVESAIAAGNKVAQLVFRAMAYQIAREIGAYAAACRGRIDALVITGGLAHSARLIAELRPYVAWLARKVIVFPGEEEMAALAGRLSTVLEGTERERSYDKEVALRG